MDALSGQYFCCSLERLKTQQTVIEPPMMMMNDDDDDDNNRRLTTTMMENGGRRRPTRRLLTDDDARDNYSDCNVDIMWIDGSNDNPQYYKDKLGEGKQEGD